MKGRSFAVYLLPVCLFLCLSCGHKESLEVKVERITVSPSFLNLTAGDNAFLTVAVYPGNADNKTILWSSSNNEVATVSVGMVVALSPGTAMIIATSHGGGKTAICDVKVSAMFNDVSGITLSRTHYELKVGENVTLTATVSPADATDKTVTWSTSDSSVATVKDGVVTALKVGFATIAAKAGGKTASCAISVVAIPVSSVTLNRTSATLKKGETLTLTATVSPADATDKTVTWSTSDRSVATVDNGVVTAVKGGTAIITATAGNKSATCTIVVESTTSDGESEDIGFEDWDA